MRVYKASLLIDGSWYHYQNAEVDIIYNGNWVDIREKKGKKTMIPISAITIMEVEE